MSNSTDTVNFINTTWGRVYGGVFEKVQEVGAVEDAFKVRGNNASEPFRS